MSKKDLLTPELRTIESEIDSYYLSNQLIQKNFAAAAWYLLAIGEDWIIKVTHDPQSHTIQNLTLISDELVNTLNYPLRWLYSSCSPNGKVIPPYSGKDYQAAVNLFKLGRNYIPFVIAFSYASLGLIELNVDGTLVSASKPISDYWEYESYNRLIRTSINFSSVKKEEFPIGSIVRSLKVKGDRFTYKISPKIVSETVKFLKPLIDPRFVLPENWQFSNFTLGEFKRVYESMFAISFIHFTMRLSAASRGCIGMGLADSIIITTFEDIVRMVTRYSEVTESRVRTIFYYLTYGSSDINSPDPTLQPLIKLNEEQYAIMPNLWTSLAAERNLAVLLNRLPCEKEVYLRLVNAKEEAMRERLKSTISHKDFRIEFGKIPDSPDLPDIDFALIDDANKTLLFIEFKWFIEPAEVGEIINKSVELKKGISQLHKLKEAYRENRKPLLDKLKLDNSYDCNLVVISANWIGLGNIQDKHVPILQERHILTKLKDIDSLRQLIDWFSTRDYLPKIEKHFDIVDDIVSVGKWNLKWYGIKPLVENEFLPI